jgi:integrase
VGGSRREIGLGGFPDVPLGTARERARELRDRIWRGEDPVAQRRAQKAALEAERRRGLTFAEAVERALEARLAEFRSEKHRRQWRSTLDHYAVPELGDMDVSEIGVQDVLRVLEPIWGSKTETASRLRGRIEAVLAWATVAGHRAGDNPARWRGNLDAILPRPGRVARAAHNPALALTDAPEWFADVRARDGMATRALEFLALTAARSGEVRGATWAELDLGAALWTIPAERMKAGREHRVPLTAEAVALLRALPRFAGSPYVFPAARGGQLSDMSLSACMRRINEARNGGYLDPRSGRPAVPHGLRSTFRDWCAEHGVDRHLSEIALAHRVGSDVERAYRRTDMLQRRRALMERWDQFLRGGAGAGAVLPFEAAQ